MQIFQAKFVRKITNCKENGANGANATNRPLRITLLSIYKKFNREPICAFSLY